MLFGWIMVKCPLVAGHQCLQIAPGWETQQDSVPFDKNNPNNLSTAAENFTISFKEAYVHIDPDF